MCHAEIPDGRTALLAPTENVEVPVDGGDRMPAQIASPDSLSAVAAGERSAAPAVVVVPDMYGPSPFYRDLCVRLSGQGLRAIMPDYFFRQGPLEDRTVEAAVARRAGLDETKTLDDLSAVIAWLRAEAGDPAAPVGVLGFCMGGTFALDLAAREHGLVTVAYYGFPVPQASLLSPPPAPLGLAEQMRGPILAFWGDLDAAVGIENVDRFVEAMRESPADFEHRVYPGLGHGFLAQAELADDSAGDDSPSQSWKLTLEMFRRHLHKSR
jgi:carboxymethylenebutenolidase